MTFRNLLGTNYSQKDKFKGIIIQHNQKIRRILRGIRLVNKMKFIFICLCLLLCLVQIQSLYNIMFKSWLTGSKVAPPVDMHIFDKDFIELQEELSQLKFHDEALLKYLEVIPHSVNELKKHFESKKKQKAKAEVKPIKSKVYKVRNKSH